MEMYVNVKLRHAAASEGRYEWQVVHDGWVYYRSEFRSVCADWRALDSNKDMDFTLKRVRLDPRGKLTDSARLALEFIVAKHGRDQKISCIKDIRTVFCGLGLKEAKELVEDYLETYCK